MSSINYSYDVTDELSSGSARVPITHLLDLPIEILVHIATFLPPIDIISLAKCCRDLNSVAGQRRVWCAALMNACHEHQVFVPTFPISQMSTDEIKEACIRPFRLRSRILSHHADSHRYPFPPVKHDGAKPKSDGMDSLKYPALTPTRRCGSLQSALSSSLESASGTNTFIDYVYLVPGGRFLLTTDDDNRIRLWDLGYKSTMTSPSSLRPLAERVFEAPKRVLTERQLARVQPTKDEQGLVFIVTLDPSREHERRCREECIFEIYPTAPVPRFELVASRLCAKHEACVELTSDVVVHRGEPTQDHIFVWYFRAGLSRRVNTGKFVLAVLIHEQTVLVVIPYRYPVGTRFSQFLIPSAPSTSTINNTDERDIPAILAHDCGKSPNTSVVPHLRFMRVCAWFNAPKERFLQHLEALLYFAEEATDRLKSDADTDFNPHIIYPPTFAHHNALQNQSETSLDLLEEYMWLQKDRISGNVHLCAMRRLARDGEDGADVIGVALDWANVEDHGTSSVLDRDWPAQPQLMCAYSGRLVLPTEGGDIEVVDFV